MTYEFQARNLGGRILVPQARLFDLVEKSLPLAKRGLPKESHQNTKLVCGWLARHLASAFEVTHAVIETRLIGDGLCGHIGLSRPPRTSR